MFILVSNGENQVKLFLEPNQTPADELCRFNASLPTGEKEYKLFQHMDVQKSNKSVEP